MERGVTYSLILHLVILLLLIFGLPSLFDKHIIQESIISVEVLPVASLSNVKPKKAPKIEQKQPEKSKEVAKAQESEPQIEEKLEPKPDPKPETKPEIDTPKPEQKPAEAIKKSNDQEEPKPQPKPEKKPEAKKEDKPKQKKKDTSELDSLLKTLEESSVKTEEEGNKKSKAEESEESEESKSKGKYNPDMPLSISEEDLIRSQIEKHWSIPVGARSSSEIKITLRITIKKTGEVMDVKIIDGTSYSGADASFYRAAADSAVRAVKKASPLQNLPPEKYNSWQELELNFDPRDVM